MLCSCFPGNHNNFYLLLTVSGCELHNSTVLLWFWVIKILHSVHSPVWCGRRTNYYKTKMFLMNSLRCNDKFVIWYFICDWPTVILQHGINSEGIKLFHFFLPSKASPKVRDKFFCRIISLDHWSRPEEGRNATTTVTIVNKFGVSPSCVDEKSRTWRGK